jgi:hypothetical protein
MLYELTSVISGHIPGLTTDGMNPEAPWVRVKWVKPKHSWKSKKGVQYAQNSVLYAIWENEWRTRGRKPEGLLSECQNWRTVRQHQRTVRPRQIFNQNLIKLHGILSKIVYSFHQY